MGTTPQEIPALAGLTVGDVMGTGFASCFPDDDLATVASRLVRDGVHAAVLTPLYRGTPRIVTDVDLIRAALSGTGQEVASDITRGPAVSLPRDAPAADAVAVMAERYARRLLVIDPGTRVPIGLVSGLDLVAPLGGIHHRLAGVPGPATVGPPPDTRSLTDAKVGDVAHRSILTCGAGVPLSVIARTMVEHRVHCVAVAGIKHPDEHLIWGLIEDIDLVEAIHRDALSESAASIAVSPPVAVEATGSLARAAELMLEHDASHLVVVGPTGFPVGVVSTLDVVTVLAAGAVASLH